MYYKVCQKSMLTAGVEQVLFYAPNYYRILIAYDRLVKAGNKNLYIREFTVEEQAKWIMIHYELNKHNSKYTFEKVKFIVEHSLTDID